MKIIDIFEEITRTGKGNAAVVGWGRGMGHRGHMFLASAVVTKAKETGADPYFVVSRTVGIDDPIKPEEKLAIYKKVFPSSANIFQVATDEMPDLTRVLRDLNRQGYDKAVVVVGADQVNALSYVKNYNGKADKAGNIPYNFDSLEVIARQEVTSDPGSQEEGPRATPMRQVLLDPTKTDAEKFTVWRDAMSPELSDAEVRELMNKAEQRMKTEFASKKKVKEAKRRKAKKSKKKSYRNPYYGYYYGNSNDTSGETGGGDGGGGESVKEAWSEKYKKSINCNNPKGFSQRAHCAGRTESAGINEVADQPYRYMLTKKTDSGNWYMFETDNGIRMVVSATLDPLPNGTFSTEIAFSEYDAKNMDITGKGDAFRIFATVGTIVKEFLRSGKPNAEITEIYFTGKTNEPSRIKLYDMIAKNINRFLINFEFKNTVGNAREKYYHFKKISTASESQISENFADGKGPGRAGDSQRQGIPKGATIAQLEKAAKASGRKGQLARWQLNMRRGKKKANETVADIEENKVAEDYKDAARYAAGAHAGQTRSGGKPYISHPVRVANLVRKYKDSKQLDKLLSAAFLHDTIEDTDTSEEQLRKMFGDLVATLVKELTSDKEKIEKLGKAEYLTQKMINMSSWGLVIKLADRLDNVADIKTAKTPEWRQRYRTETENILTQLEQNRELSGTHKKIIQAIRGKLAEIDESYVNEANEDPVKPLVYLDMDGVLADFFGEWAKLDGKDHYKDIGNTEAALQMVREHPTFWIDLDVLPGAKQLIATVIKHYGEYRICSKQLEGDPRCRAGKIAWIKTHLADMLPKEIHIVDEKTPFAVDVNGNPNILVDDYGKNIIAWKAAGGIAIKYDSNNYNDALKLLVSLSKV